MSRPNGVFKTSNEYARLFKDYDKIPKAVFAAVAASFIMRCMGEDFDKVQNHFIDEWNVLCNNEIVPQKALVSK